MTSKKLTDWYIPNSPIWDYCEQILIKEKEIIKVVERENDKDNLIEQLQISSYSLYECKFDLLEYVQYNSHPAPIMDLMKSLFFTLHETLVAYEKRIVELGSSVDIEFRNYGTKLKHRHESESLTEMYKVPRLYNADEIKRDFLNQLKGSANNGFYPSDIFESKLGFEVFKKFAYDYIVDAYGDFSFLFYRLKSEKFIKDIKHKYFIDWMEDNGHYKKPHYYKVLFEKGQFSKKYNSAVINNNFNIVLEEVKAKLE